MATSAKRKPQNPYIAGRALNSQRGFFGREDVFQLIEQVLASPDDNAIVLFGQRRIGKTSILFQLRSRLPRLGYVPIYFDLMHKAEKPLGSVLHELTDRITSELLLPEPLKASDFDDQGVFFRERFLPIVHEALGDEKRLVLLFDEFDVLDAAIEGKLSPPMAAKAFFPYLSQLMEEERDLKFVFVIGRKAEELSTDALAIFKTARYQRVSVLERKDAVPLITQTEKSDTLHFTPEAIDHICALTNGHPFLTQLLCHILFNQAWAANPHAVPIVTVQEVENAIPHALEQGTSQLEWIWNGLPPAEKVVMAAIAKVGERVASKEDLLKILQQHGIRILIRELELAPETLVKWELMGEVDGGYYFFIEMIRRWVAKTKQLPKVKEELDRIDPLADLHFLIGERHYLASQHSDAADELRRAINLNPDHVKARVLLGEVLREQGKLHQAVEVLEEAFHRDEDQTRFRLLQALLGYGQELETQNDLDGALVVYERVLGILPEEQVAEERRRAIWKHRGDVLLTAGEVDAALEAYKQAKDDESVSKILERIRTEEKLARLYEQGLAALNRDKWAEAEEILKEVVYIQPDYQDAVELLARAHQARYAGKKSSRVKVELKEAEAVQVPLKQLVLMKWPLAVLAALACLGIMFITIAIASYNAWAWWVVVILGFFIFGLWANIWETIRQKDLRWPGSLDEFLSADYDGEGQVALIGNDGIARVWDLTEAREVGSDSGHKRAKSVCLLSRKSSVVLADGYLWDITTGDKTKLLSEARKTWDSMAAKLLSEARKTWDSMAVNLDNTVLAVSLGESASIQLLEVTSRKQVGELDGHKSQTMVFSPNGQLLASSESLPRGDDVHIWNVASRQLLHELIGNGGRVLSLAFDSRGQMLAMGSRNGVIRIWDAASPDTIRVLATSVVRQDMTVLDFSPDDLLLLSGGTDQVIQIWDVYSWKCIGKQEADSAVLKAKFTIDGKQIVVICKNGIIHRWKVLTEYPIAK
jgi:tetratricopeptide (TPR) repeat protein